MRLFVIVFLCAVATASLAQWNGMHTGPANWKMGESGPPPPPLTCEAAADFVATCPFPPLGVR